MVDDGKVCKGRITEMRCRLMGQTGQSIVHDMQHAVFAGKNHQKGRTVRYCQNDGWDYKLAVDNTELTLDAAGRETASA